MKQNLIQHFTWLANSLSMGYMYKEWDDTTVRKDMKEAYDKFYQSLQLENNKDLINFEKLTQDEAKELGFGKWNEETNLYLLPLYLVPLLPKGIELTYIDGETFIFDKIEDLDLDIRFGMLSFGVVLNG